MTPAINLAKKLKLDYSVHEYSHDPNNHSYGLEAAEKLNIDANRVFKTLVVEDEQGDLAVAVLPVNQLLNLKKMAKALGRKKMAMADPAVVERSTGYILGGVSPLGQKKRLPTIIDQTATTHATIFCSGGRRGLEIELAPQALAAALSAKFVDILQE